MAWWMWGLLILSPIDLLPDWILGPVGFLDDLFYFWKMMKSLEKT